jgi:hypothetical protein
MSAAVTAPQAIEDLAAAYSPANAHERMLAINVAQSWRRLQRAYDLEERYAETHDLFDVIGANVDQFKALTRYVTECERAWRHAVTMLETAQKRRERAERPAPEKRVARARRVPPPAETRVAVVAPVVEINPPHRE